MKTDILDRIKNGNFLKIPFFFGKTFQPHVWDNHLYNYMKSIHIGLNKKLTDLNFIKNENDFIDLANPNNLSEPISNIKESFNNLNEYFKKLRNLIDDPTMEKTFKINNDFISLLKEETIKSFNKNIIIVNQTIFDINELQETTLIFKKYMIIKNYFKKNFNEVNIDINFNTEINNSLDNIILLEKFIEKKYIFYDVIPRLHIKFILKFLNSEQKLITRDENFDKLIKSIETNIANLNGDVNNVSIDLFREFLKKIDFEFSLLDSDSNINEIKNEDSIDNFYDYIIAYDKTKIKQFNDTLDNFKYFINLKFWEIFNKFKTDNIIFGQLNESDFDQSKEGFKFFLHPDYEKLISIIYNLNGNQTKKLKLESSKLSSKIIISNNFNYGKHGEVKDFINSFKDLIKKESNKYNVIIKYIMIDHDIIKEIKNLEDKVKTAYLMKSKKINENFEIIIKLGESLENEINTHINFINAYLTKFK